MATVVWVFPEFNPCISRSSPFNTFQGVRDVKIYLSRANLKQSKHGDPSLIKGTTSLLSIQFIYQNFF
jgi:hypothetical protein